MMETTADYQRPAWQKAVTWLYIIASVLFLIGFVGVFHPDRGVFFAALAGLAEGSACFVGALVLQAKHDSHPPS